MLFLAIVIVDISFISSLWSQILSFHDLLQIFNCTQLKTLISAEKPAYFKILYC